ncbi:MAG: peptide chain release factor N(5)-glutamine methyltransferase [Rhizobiaceae bacterium]|nr:peptide chain release factor N(5)-glutamine methyltransferase [Rhizobiaceae bacterium]
MKNSSVGEAVSISAKKLRNAGIDDFSREARLLAGHVFDLGPAELISGNLINPALEKIVELDRLIERRIAGEPAYRIVGRKEIYGCQFRISKDTLEPRPDTEALIEGVLADQQKSGNKPLKILDIGTGTGIIIISLLDQMPNATGIATDISAEAIMVAKENAVLNKVEARISFVVTDWSGGIEQKFDVIVSNPPYIKTDVIPMLANEVKDYDPWLALDGGKDGLNAYRAIFTQCLSKLANDGKLYLEIGHDQAESIVLLAEQYGWIPVQTRKDLNGISRVVVFRQQYLME